MTLVNELTLLSVLKLLARNYPYGIEGEEVWVRVEVLGI